jgi:nitroimidazol reductase NimA-like FMN-containing flavoprotein (pyridoxamine 5'-phosphate oxidase superfamily)
MQAELKTMSREQIDEFLNSQRVGLLSLADGTSAYAVPLGYSYDGKDIYLTIGNKGRKMGYINSCRNVCFVVYWMQDNFGVKTGMSYKSVICDGVLEQVTEPKAITKVVRDAEKHLGFPEGTWDGLLKTTLENPSNSCFWKINVTRIGSQAVNDFKEGAGEQGSVQQQK